MYKRVSQSWIKHLDFMMLDLVCMHIAFVIAYLVRNGLQNPYGDDTYVGLMLCVSFVNWVVAIALESFKNVLKRGYYEEFLKTLRHAFIVMIGTIAYLFIIKESAYISRMVVLLMGVLYVGISYIIRLVWKQYLRNIWENELNQKSLLVVTTEDMAEAVLRGFQYTEFKPIRVSGLVLPNASKIGASIAGAEVVASFESATEYICHKWVDEVLISVQDMNLYPGKLICDLMEMGVVVHIGMPDSFNPYGQEQVVERIGSMTVLTSSIRYVSGTQLFLKRTMDIAGGVAGSLMAIVLMLIIGPMIYINDPGPILFKQIRVGRNGKCFTIYKFRSMYQDAEQRKQELMSRNVISDGMMFKMDNDPRIIGIKIGPDGSVKKGIGNFIRDYSLDEFPQFFNVLRGEMSIVGTRPPTVDEWNKYKLHHRKRLAIKPGITGLWQISGRSNIIDFEEVVKLDAKYIADWNLGKDVKIILETVKCVVKKDGAK